MAPVDHAASPVAATPSTAASVCDSAVDVTVVADGKVAGGDAAVVAEKSQPPQQQQPTKQSVQKALPSLLVTGLRNAVTEEFLLDAFGKMGPVAAVRVERGEAKTANDAVYAQVDYFHREDAERAVDVLNFSYALGPAVQVGWAQPQQSNSRNNFNHNQQQQSFGYGGKQPRTPSGNIVVRNIDPAVTETELRELCAQHGRVVYCKLMQSQFEQELVKHAFVHFDTVDQASAAVKAMDGHLMNGLKLSVLHQTSRRGDNHGNNNNRGYGGHNYNNASNNINNRHTTPVQQSTAPSSDNDSANFTNVYVKNIAEETTDQEFSDLFLQHGPVTSHVLVRDDSGRPRGFGFVNYERHEDAVRAVDGVNGVTVHGRDLYVGRAQKKHEREEELRRRFDDMRFGSFQPNSNNNNGINGNSNYNGGFDRSRPCTLFVKSVNEGVLDEELIRRHFEPFGAVSGVRVLFDENGVSRGFGFVTYVNSQDAARALAEMNDSMCGPVHLYVAAAQKKDTRRAGSYGRQHQQPRHGGSNNGYNNSSNNNSNAMLMQFMPTPPQQYYGHPHSIPFYMAAPSAAQLMGMPPSPAMSPVLGGASMPPQQQSWMSVYEMSDAATQQQMLGERVFSHVMQRYPQDQAQAITSQLLATSDNAQLLALLDGDDVAALDAQVAAAVSVLTGDHSATADGVDAAAAETVATA